MILNLCFMVVFFTTPLRQWSMTLLSWDSFWAVGAILLHSNSKFCLTLCLSDLCWNDFRTASCTALPLRKLSSHVEKKPLIRKWWYTATRQTENQWQLTLTVQLQLVFVVGGHEGTQGISRSVCNVPQSFLRIQTVRISEYSLGIFGKGKGMLVPSVSKAEEAFCTK